MYIHAGLDDENKELQQKLAVLKVESRQKEAVNQALSQEVAECRHKQQNGQLGESWAGCTLGLARCILSQVFWCYTLAHPFFGAKIKSSFMQCTVRVPFAWSIMYFTFTNI